MARILVTGIGGFTGRFMAAELCAAGHEVVGIVHDDSQSTVPGMAVSFVADLTDSDALTRIVREVAPEHLVHLAAIAFVGHGDARAIYETNLIGTLNVLEALAGNQQVVRSLLLASSANVYGNLRGGQLSEDVPPVPSNHYGISKLATEHMANIFRERIPIIVARPFNYTGVGQSPDFIIPKLIDHARRRQNVIELGNLDVARDFSDVRMVVDCYTRLLTAEDAIGKTINICSGRGYTLREVIAMIEDLSGIQFDVRMNPDFVRAGEIKTLFGSRELLEKTIGIVEVPELRETLRWMLEA